MLKKFTLISTLIGLSISTLGGLVPTFADNSGEGYYYAPELAALHTKYAASMAECGEYSSSYEYQSCYDRITSFYREKYGGKFESMYQLDFNGRMIVTGINPTAGTVRFYADETKAFRGESFEFQNLFVFWTDRSVVPTPSWDDDIAWNFVDNLLATGEVLPGYHLLYQGKKDTKDWITINAENRIVHEDKGDAVGDNQFSHIFVLGYDTEGNKHFEKQDYAACIRGGYTEGNECRLQYHYNGRYAEMSYIQTTPTPEDKVLIDLKNAIKEAKAAEAAAREAEAVAREAETAAREARTTADAAEAAAREAETIAREAEAAAREAETIAREAEAAVSEAKSIANETKAAADTAVSTANEALRIARELADSTAKTAKEAAITHQTILKAVEDASRIAEEANQKAANLSDLAKSAAARVESLAANITPGTTKIIERYYETKASTSTNNDATLNNSTSELVTSATLETPPSQTPDSLDSEERVALPLTNNQAEFPWWIIVFVFSGIALILWWCVPARKK